MITLGRFNNIFGIDIIDCSWISNSVAWYRYYLNFDLTYTIDFVQIFNKEEDYVEQYMFVVENRFFIISSYGLINLSMFLYLVVLQRRKFADVVQSLLDAPLKKFIGLLIDFNGKSNRVGNYYTCRLGMGFSVRLYWYFSIIVS